MDEPTSSLDPIAAKDIEDLIKTYLNDKTCIFITHRLSLALYADEIIVMQKGKIVEQGDHICLIQKNGLYKKCMMNKEFEKVKRNASVGEIRETVCQRFSKDTQYG